MITKVVLEKANRLHQMPPRLLSFVRAEQNRGLVKKSEVLDLATFSWNIPFEPASADDVNPLSPASTEQIAELKEEIAAWMQSVHNCRILPDKEIYVGNSITSLVWAICLAFLDSGDVAFVPELAAPLYRLAVTSAGGEPVGYTLSAKTNWQPDFTRLTSRLGRVARLAFVNTPHNPTGAELSEKEMNNLLWTASREHILVVNDAAYQGIPDRTPISMLSLTGGKKVGVEVYSFSYQFGLPRLPYGFVVGNREVISALKYTDRLMPAMMPKNFLDMAVSAMRKYPDQPLRDLRKRLIESGDRAAQLIDILSLEKSGFRTVPYLWAKIPSRRNSTAFCRQLYRRNRVLLCPGTDFGESGQGYVRISLTANPRSFEEAVGRLRRKRRLLKKKSESPE